MSRVEKSVGLFVLGGFALILAVVAYTNHLNLPLSLTQSEYVERCMSYGHTRYWCEGPPFDDILPRPGVTRERLEQLEEDYRGFFNSLPPVTYDDFIANCVGWRQLFKDGLEWSEQMLAVAELQCKRITEQRAWGIE